MGEKCCTQIRARNSAPDLKARLETVVHAGATPEQIRDAIAIANAIKRTAEQKIAAALGDSAEAGESCCAPDRAVDQPSSSEKAASCGCR